MEPILLFVLALAGLADSAYLLWHKVFNKKLVCIIGKDCDEVVKSKYGKVFGIPNELFGSVYYLFIAGSALLIMEGTRSMLGFDIMEAARLASFAAVFASVYLALIQVFRLKKWCEYCLASAGINLAILFLLV